MITMDEENSVLENLIDKVSKYYDVQTLTNDMIEAELSRIYKELCKISETLVALESMDEQPDELDKVYAEKWALERQYDALANYASYRYHKFVEAVVKAKSHSNIRYNNLDDWEITPIKALQDKKMKDDS